MSYFLITVGFALVLYGLATMPCKTSQLKTSQLKEPTRSTFSPEDAATFGYQEAFPLGRGESLKFDAFHHNAIIRLRLDDVDLWMFVMASGEIDLRRPK